MATLAGQRFTSDAGLVTSTKSMQEGPKPVMRNIKFEIENQSADIESKLQEMQTAHLTCHFARQSNRPAQDSRADAVKAGPACADIWQFSTSPKEFR